jgi:hypothetical protein
MIQLRLARKFCIVNIAIHKEKEIQECNPMSLTIRANAQNLETYKAKKKAVPEIKKRLMLRT